MFRVFSPYYDPGNVNQPFNYSFRVRTIMLFAVTAATVILSQVGYTLNAKEFMSVSKCVFRLVCRSVRRSFSHAFVKNKGNIYNQTSATGDLLGSLDASSYLYKLVDQSAGLSVHQSVMSVSLP